MVSWLIYWEGGCVTRHIFATDVYRSSSNELQNSDQFPKFLNLLQNGNSSRLLKIDKHVDNPRRHARFHLS